MRYRISFHGEVSVLAENEEDAKIKALEFLLTTEDEQRIVRVREEAHFVEATL